VRLTDDERHGLLQLTKSGKAAASKIKPAHILWPVDANGPNWSDAPVAKAFPCHGHTVRNVRQRFVEQGLEAALRRKKQGPPSRQRLLDGAQEAHWMALRCSQPPAGQAQWTLQWLAEQLVALTVVEAISYETVRQTRKKIHANHTCTSAGGFRLRTVQTVWPPWKMCWTSSSTPMIPRRRWSTWTKSPCH
jgi:hypothetical protein